MVRARASNALNVIALRVSKDLVDSVSVLNVSSIALSLGMGIMPTMDIISVLSGAGLTLAQPRVAKDWSAKTRKLVFQGLSTSLFSIFWIQACGIDVVSISMLAVAIVSGFVLPILISKLFSNRITSHIKKKLSPVQI